ncbi:MAG: universal stress protein [Pseudomonadota bacterium]
MALKSIICLLNGFEHETAAADAALQLAKDNGADIRLLHITYPVQSYSGFFGEAAMVGGGWQEIVDQQSQHRLSKARNIAEGLIAKHGLGSPVDTPAGTARAAFVPLENKTTADVVRQLSLCDLIVFGAEAGSSDLSDASIAGTALFSTGRPLLMVRPKKGDAPSWTGKTCALAWNDSPEAIRAVTGARDLIRTASKVHVLVTHERSRADDAPENTVVLDYLGSHGVTAEFHAVMRGSGAAAAAVLQQAKVLGCDYLVMGAYGHTVFREMLLGGFTAYMLEEAEMPLVLAH